MTLEQRLKDAHFTALVDRDVLSRKCGVFTAMADYFLGVKWRNRA